jgi:hypothetical protein
VLTRKDLIVAVLLTFCLTVTLFMILPTQSSPGNGYDPWLDANDDGTINILDIAALALDYGTSGNPTKNVTIAGHVTKLLKLAEGVSIFDMSSWNSGWIPIDGYSKVTFHVLLAYEEHNRIYIEAPSGYVDNYRIEVVEDFPSLGWTKTYDVMHEQIRIRVYNFGTSTATLYVHIYLMA